MAHKKDIAVECRSVLGDNGGEVKFWKEGRSMRHSVSNVEPTTTLLIGQPPDPLVLGPLPVTRRLTTSRKQ